MKKIVLLGALALVLLSVLLLGCTGPSKACTQGAKICPDGSAVGRTLPNCEFAPCPGQNFGQTDCNSFDYFDCPAQCAVCPPCPVCSSIACRAPDFCEAAGFDRNWYDSVRPKQN